MLLAAGWLVGGGVRVGGDCAGADRARRPAAVIGAADWLLLLAVFVSGLLSSVMAATRATIGTPLLESLRSE